MVARGDFQQYLVDGYFRLLPWRLKAEYWDRFSAANDGLECRKAVLADCAWDVRQALDSQEIWEAEQQCLAAAWRRSADEQPWWIDDSRWERDEYYAALVERYRPVAQTSEVDDLDDLPEWPVDRYGDYVW